MSGESTSRRSPATSRFSTAAICPSVRVLYQSCRQGLSPRMCTAANAMVQASASIGATAAARPAGRARSNHRAAIQPAESAVAMAIGTTW